MSPLYFRGGHAATLRSLRDLDHRAGAQLLDHALALAHEDLARQLPADLLLHFLVDGNLAGEVPLQDAEDVHAGWKLHGRPDLVFLQGEQALFQLGGLDVEVLFSGLPAAIVAVALAGAVRAVIERQEGLEVLAVAPALDQRFGEGSGL